MRKNKLKEYTINFVIVISSIVFTLIIMEIALICFYPQITHHDDFNDFFIYDREIGWMGKPNYSGDYIIFNSDNKPFEKPRYLYKEHISTNSFGFKDKEYNITKNSNTKYRIFVIGDSYTWGMGVNNSKVFHSILEDKYFLDIDFINLGFGGHSTVQNYLKLKRYAPIFNPDMVILMFCANDYTDNFETSTGYKSKPNAILKENGEVYIPASVPSPPISGHIKHELYYKTHLGYLVMNRLGQFSNIEKILIDRESDIPPSLNNETLKNYQYDLNDALMDKINDFCKLNSMKLIVIPVNRNQSQLKKYCENNNVTYIDIYLNNPNGFPGHGPGDGHWNTTGHEMVAETIYSSVIGEQLTPLGGKQ